MKPVLLWVLLTVVAGTVAFGVAVIVSLALNTILPPFQFPEDDDSMREFIPVVTTYATWAITTVLGSALGVAMDPTPKVTSSTGAPAAR